MSERYVPKVVFGQYPLKPSYEKWLSRVRQTHCLRGHSLEGVRPNKNGSRNCPTCRNERVRVWKKNHKELVLERQRKYREEHRLEIIGRKRKAWKEKKRRELKEAEKFVESIQGRVYEAPISQAYNCPECLGDGMIEKGVKLLRCGTCYGRGTV